MSQESLPRPISVEIDIPVTRRIKLHAVVDGDGVQVFHSKSICEVFEWLLEREVHMITLLGADHEFQAILSLPLSPPTSEKG